MYRIAFNADNFDEKKVQKLPIVCVGCGSISLKKLIKMFILEFAVKTVKYHYPN